jgi:hypothetical protein
MKCKEEDCNNQLQWAHEAETGLCGMCGPGSHKAQIKVKIDTGLINSIPVIEKIPDCLECGSKLQYSHELETGKCYLCGPGSAKAQEKENATAFDRFKHPAHYPTTLGGPVVIDGVLETKTCSFCNKILPSNIFEHGAGNGQLCSNNFREVEKIKGD